ncbi:hypothetical protein N657DRAFT_642080 [Parathielavia appendiculata]|uniref:Uncharacterized protein n=1 Tax=Parathielavia appendiculata TaxID=2587402 RepID=A0AAN6Z7K6_9PEZI|nr:hypothetical protein N657DRAFT_642080 [Parathielavia appendiculata]
MAASKKTSVPVALFGKDERVSEAVKEKLLPDFEVVHICNDVGSAVSEFPPLFRGKSRVPEAVFFGGNFSDAEYQAIVKAVMKTCGENVPKFIKCQKFDVLAAGSFGPNPNAIAKVFRKKMAAATAA